LYFAVIQLAAPHTSAIFRGVRMKTPQPVPLYDLNCDGSDQTWLHSSEKQNAQQGELNSPVIDTASHCLMIRNTLCTVLEQTKSAYCFAAFINMSNNTLAHLFMSNGIDFISQRTDNTNFKKFWEEAFLRNEPVIENNLPVQCTISTNNEQFRIFRYASIPVQNQNSTIIFILFNKESDYSENDTLAATLCIEELVIGIDFTPSRKHINENPLFNQILPALKESVIVTNLDGTILIINNAAQSLIGYSESEAAGMNIDMLLQATPAIYQQTDSIDTPDNWICTCTTREKSSITIEGKTIQMKDDPGTHSGYIHVFNTCTTGENSQAEQLMNSHRIESIGILAGGMAHDFNNYLTGIINFVNLAKFCTTSRQIELYLDNTLAIANDAQTLTKQFLKYSKNYESINKKVIIDRILKENISILFKGSNIKAELHIDDNLNFCNVDEDKISQLFGSLIINAREAMPEGGIIDITVKNEHVTRSEKMPYASGDYVSIQIRDNGCGMSQDVLNNLFKPYFTTKPRRSGLGLASAKIIAEYHQGYITVSSEVNAGSTFTVYLPIAKADKLETPSNEDKHTHGKILVMDDEYYIRQTSLELLKKKNFEVCTAIHGNEALNIYKQAFETGVPFDLVILDLTVPEGLGGMETLKKLEMINPDVKAIASSGYSDDPVIVHPEKYGFEASLAKPYNLNEFLNCITSVLSNEW
jgi:signal transduction histidine kinase/ActR/RegA family two-component response regulator